MVDITPLYELVQLVTDFLPVILILVMVAFFIGLLFLMFPTGNQGGKLRVDKKIKFLIPMLMIFSVLMASTPGNSAVGITYDAVPINATLMTVKITGLTTGNEYTIYASSNAESFTNITFIANSPTEFVPLPVLDETDGYYLNLAQSAAGVNVNITATTDAGASVWVSPRDAGDLLPIDAFFDLMVPIILIVIVVGVVVSFVTGVGRKSGGRD